MTERFNAGDMVDGRYRILNRLGSGGMADVYCAQDTQLGRNVALKVLYRRFAEDSEFLERFRREASSTAGLQHPNVVSVYDRGEEDGAQYIAMEFVDGRSLKEIVRAEGALAPERAIALTEQILRAARFAHKRGIVHRDLKPHNVLVDAEDRAKVADFGIARAGASEMTQTGSIMGTAQYLSPEQAQGHPVSVQSDLYSIGIVLYELLTGRVPFDGESAVAVALQQVNAEPVPPSQLNSAVTPELERVVLHALEKDPARRPADADEFLAELEAARASLPETATAVPTPVLPLPTMLPAELGETLTPPDPSLTAPYEAVGYVDPIHAPLPPPQDEGASRRWWLFVIGLLVVAALIVGALLLFGTKKVSVPLVVGDPEGVARTTLIDKGFHVVSQTRLSVQPKGQVTRQSPLAGAKIKEGATVTLTVSGGPGTAQIPELGGKPRGAARQALVALGFQVDEKSQPDPDVAKNHVIRTDPLAGQDADKNSTVTLIVSSGPEMVQVPNVVGKSRDDAQTALGDAGFEIKVTQQESSDKDPGTVLAQDPAAGKSVVKGSSVAITVAIAQTHFDVPNVVGKSLDDAVATLSGDGFKVEVTRKTVQTTSQDSVVLAQDPATGKLEKGKTVSLTVGRFQSSGTSTTSTSTNDQGSP